MKKPATKGTAQTSVVLSYSTPKGRKGLPWYVWMILAIIVGPPVLYGLFLLFVTWVFSHSHVT